jgi:hypothetical protein
MLKIPSQLKLHVSYLYRKTIFKINKNNFKIFIKLQKSPRIVKI